MLRGAAPVIGEYIVAGLDKSVGYLVVRSGDILGELAVWMHQRQLNPAKSGDHREIVSGIKTPALLVTVHQIKDCAAGEAETGERLPENDFRRSRAMIQTD